MLFATLSFILIQREKKVCIDNPRGDYMKNIRMVDQFIFSALIKKSINALSK